MYRMPNRYRCYLPNLGLGYEREEECSPVRYEPASIVVYMNADGVIELHDTAPEITLASGCQDAAGAVKFPSL
jgi:hypothetical protein